TTDHISPAGAFSSSTPAGQYLISLGIPEEAFNSYGSRRGNHQIMMRGTFANRRLRNKMASREGGYTLLLPEEKETSIFEASQIYAQRKTSLILFAGKDYGMGSSRDWAAKGTSLLGVRVVVARSFERIHRSNLIGMGILPLEFPEGISHESLALTGKETFSILLEELRPRQEVILLISSKQNVPLLSRLDTETEVDYYLHGGILPYVLRQMLPA
ncbi:MAG: aconitate hydratase, partial [Chlamydiae bacterium]|nr:aconitate hydratase [Chlamydiota bacterium]